MPTDHTTRVHVRRVCACVRVRVGGCEEKEAKKMKKRQEKRGVEQRQDPPPVERAQRPWKVRVVPVLLSAGAQSWEGGWPTSTLQADADNERVLAVVKPARVRQPVSPPVILQ